MAEKSIFSNPFPGMDPGFAQFYPLSDREFTRLIRRIQLSSQTRSPAGKTTRHTGPHPDLTHG